MISVVMLCSVAEAVSAASGFTIDAYGNLTEYSGTGTAVMIPDGVTSIADDVFKNKTGITSVKIPEGVTGIGNYTLDCY